MSSSGYVHIEFDAVKHVTDGAILFLIQNEEVWVPKSVIASEDVGQYKAGDGDGSVSIQERFAAQKGLV